MFLRDQAVNARYLGTKHLDDRQDTHDLVQVWNHDRHITGTQFQSHNAFCARCHSPYLGNFLPATQSIEERVFAEDKQRITCIGCHLALWTIRLRYASGG